MRQTIALAAATILALLLAPGCRYGSKLSPNQKQAAQIKTANAAKQSIPSPAIPIPVTPGNSQLPADKFQQSQLEIFQLYASPERNELPQAAQDIIAKHHLISVSTAPSVRISPAAKTISARAQVRQSFGHPTPKHDLPNPKDDPQPELAATQNLPDDLGQALSDDILDAQKRFRESRIETASEAGNETLAKETTAPNRFSEIAKQPQLTELPPAQTTANSETNSLNPLAKIPSEDIAIADASRETHVRGMLGNVLKKSQRELQEFSLFGEALTIAIILVGFVVILWIRLEYDHRKEIIRSRATPATGK